MLGCDDHENLLFSWCLDGRVEAVQAALVALSGIEQGDQILMHDGARLDPTRSLVQYNLQVLGGLSPYAGTGI